MPGECRSTNSPAIEEWWRVLGAVKTEFGKFGGALDRVQRQLNTVTHTIEETGDAAAVACHRKWQRPEAVRRPGVAPLGRRRQARAGSPNSLAIGEKQMDPIESATILALPAMGSAEVESEDASEQQIVN